MTTAEMVTIGAASFNAVVIPIVLTAIRGAVQKIADESAGKVKAELAEHQRHDDERFEAVLDKLQAIDDKRQDQHAENQKAFGALATGIEFLKGTIMQLPHG